MSRRYDTDLTDAQWDVIAPMIPDAQAGGRPRKATSRKDDADASDEQERQARQPTYVAHVSLPFTGMQTEDGFAPLEAGMAVTAKIWTGRRSVIIYLLSPLRFKQEELRER